MALCFTDKQFYEKHPLLIEFSFCFRQLLVNVVTMRVFAVNVLLGVGGSQSKSQSSTCHENNDRTEIGSKRLVCEKEVAGRRKRRHPPDLAHAEKRFRMI